MTESNSQYELTAIIPDSLIEPLESYFFELPDCRWGLMQKEKGDPFSIFGYFADEAAALAALDELRTEFPDLPAEFNGVEIADETWQFAYKAFVQPWSDRRLHWIPLWERENLSPPEGAAVVYLDAGMAFGTGSHETTRLCARRLQDFQLQQASDALAGVRVIDAGCGSGVLALSAVALGFKDVYAFDFDPDAIKVCRDNERDNPHLDRVTYAVADLAQGLQGRTADLLLANIQTNVLLPEIAHLVHAVQPNSVLALSGILSHELQEVRDAYVKALKKAHGAEPLVDSRIDGEWGDLCFTVRGS